MPKKFGIQKKGTGRAVLNPQTQRKSEKSVKCKAGLRISGSQPFRPRPNSPYPHSPVTPFRPKLKDGGSPNTSRENRLEELGRVDAEKAGTRQGKRNLKDEKRRIVKELKK